MSTGELKYTNHAFDRMTERGITRPMVEAVVVSGELEREERPGVRRYRLEGLVVIVDHGAVVTAFFDSDTRQRGQWGPKKRQRKGRIGELKPHYFDGRGKVNVRKQQFYFKQTGVRI